MFSGLGQFVLKRRAWSQRKQETKLIVPGPKHIQVLTMPLEIVQTLHDLQL
jgi:hypothetical protein